MLFEWISKRAEYIFRRIEVLNKTYNRRRRSFGAIKYVERRAIIYIVRLIALSF